MQLIGVCQSQEICHVSAQGQSMNLNILNLNILRKIESIYLKFSLLNLTSCIKGTVSQNSDLGLSLNFMKCWGAGFFTSSFSSSIIE